MRKLCLVAIAVSLALASCKKSEDAPDANVPSSTPAPARDESAEPSTPVADPAQQAPAPSVKSGEEPPAEVGGNALEQPVEYKNLSEAEAALATAKSDLDKLLTKPGGGADRLSVSDSRCENACRALASMKRAADAVCRLAGDADTRCKKARTLVKDSESRVSVCKCEG